MLLKDAIKKIISEMSDEELYNFIDLQIDTSSSIFLAAKPDVCLECPYADYDNCVAEFGHEQCLKMYLPVLNGEMSAGDYAKLKNSVLAEIER